MTISTPLKVMAIRASVVRAWHTEMSPSWRPRMLATQCVISAGGVWLAGGGDAHGGAPFVGCRAPVGVRALGPAGWRGQPRRARGGRRRVFGPGSPARQRFGERP